MEANEPLTFNDAIASARELGADDGDALLAIERVAQTGVVRRVFLDLEKTPPQPLSWDQVLIRLGGKEGLAGDEWRKGAKTLAVQWIRGESSEK
jgi:hypothetical protein